jgi:hypothetical protein
MSNYSRLDGVNLMLAEIFVPRITTLESTGSWPSKTYTASPPGDAEYYIDLYARQVCQEGLDSRCSRNKSFNTGGGTIDLGSRVVKVVGKGAIENRQLDVRPSSGSVLLFDNEAGSTTFAAGTYTVDVWEEAPFEELNGSEQAKVLAYALPKFAALFGGMVRDNQEEKIRAEVMNAPITPRTSSRRNRPMMMPQQPQQ